MAEGLTYGLPSAVAAGLNEPQTMRDQAANRERLINGGMAPEDAARASGIETTPPSKASYGEQFVPALQSYAANAARGVGNLVSDVTGLETPERLGDAAFEAVRPSLEDQAKIDERAYDRQRKLEAGEITEEQALGGQILDGIPSTAAYMGGGLAGGLGAKQGTKLTLGAIEKLGKAIPGKGKIASGAALFGGLMLSGGYNQSVGQDRLKAQGIDVDTNPEADALNNKQAVFRGALEQIPIMKFFGVKGAAGMPRTGSVVKRFLVEGGKTAPMEAMQEIVDTSIEETFMNPGLRKEIMEKGWKAWPGYVAENLSDELIVAGAGGAIGGAGVGAAGGSIEQQVANTRLKGDVKTASTVLEPLGLGTPELEELAKTGEGAKKLSQGVARLGRIERARKTNLKLVDEQLAAGVVDEEVAVEWKKSINDELDRGVDDVATDLGAPKSLSDVRKEQVAWDTERKKAATERLRKVGITPGKDISPDTAEEVAARVSTADARVEQLQTRVEATASPERKAETQLELDEARSEQRQARIDARIAVEGATPAQALKAVEAEGRRTEAERRREQQSSARERAIERQTEIEFPETLAPKLQVERAQQIIAEAEADVRPDAGLDGKIKRLERQRRAATSPEDVDKLSNEIADLEARRGLPTPAVEAARRVLQAQGVAVPQGSMASRPAAQPTVSAGLQPSEAASGLAGTAVPAGPRSALDTPTPTPTSTPEAGLAASLPTPPVKGSSGFAAPGGLPYKDLTAKLGVAKTLDKLEEAMMEWSKETGFEAGAHVAADGTVLGVGTNEDPNILMPPAEGLNDPDVTFTHTHTSDTPFSVADVRAMLKSGQRFRAILPDGSIIEMRPLAPYDDAALNEMFQLVRGDLADTMPRDIDFIEGAQIKQEAMLQAMEMAGIIEYVRPFRGLAQNQKEIVNATIDRNADAIARIGAGVAGRAGTAEAGQPGGTTGERRATDEEAGEGADPEDEIADLLGDPFDFRHAARDRRPSVNRQRLRELAETLHADLLARSAKGKADKGRPLINGVGSGEVTVEHIERGLQAWVDNDGYKRMHALTDVVRRMFLGKDFKLKPEDLRDATRSQGKVKAGAKYREIKPEALQAHRIALELAEKVSYAGRGYIDGPTIWIRSRSGQRFRSGLVKVDDRLKNFLEFSSPPHTRFDTPMPDPKDTKKLKRDVKGNVFDADALTPARRTAEYLQANTYTLDAAKIAALTPDDMISSKGLAASGLKMEDLERYRALERTPKGQWTPEDTKFMSNSGDNINERLKVAANKLSQLREAHRLFVAENGPDAEAGFMYQVDNRGRIYADGQFNPQGGSAIKAIFKHKGTSIGDYTEVDASASGWQINALMARDHVAAPQINLGRGSATAPGGKKRDLYVNTIASVVEKIQQDADIDLKTVPIGQRADAARRQRVAQTFIRVGLGPDGKLNRNAIKASVIAVNYGGTKANFQQNLRKVFQAEIDQGMFRGVSNDRPWSYIGDLAYDSLRTTAPHSLALQVWSIDAISRLAKAVDKKYPPGEAPPLVFSVGLEGKVKVKKKKTIEAEGEVRNRTAAAYARDDKNEFLLDADGNRVVANTSREDVVTLKAKVDALEVDGDKVGRAVWANIVQGFDASVLHRAVERYKQMTNGAYITTNHDSFTVPPEHEAAIAAAVRESMREIMEQVDAPARIYKEIMDQAAQHGVDLDVKPFDNMGQYNMDDLMTSTPVFGEGAKGEDYIPDYADIPEDAPALRRAVDPEVPEGGGGATAPGSSPARVPVRGQGASTIADLAPEVRQAVDVAQYMEQLDKPNQIMTGMQNLVRNPATATKAHIRKLDRSLFNTFQPIRSLEKRVRGDGTIGVGMESAFKSAELAINDSGRNESLLYYGAGAFGPRGEFTAASGTVGLRDIFKTASGGKKDGQKLQHWFEYMVAQRAKELQAKGIKTPLKPQDIQTALARSNPDFVAAEKMWRDFNRANLKMLLDSGRITKPQHDAMAVDDFYVPFYRTDQNVDGTAPDLDLPAFRQGAGGDLRARDPGIKAIKGGDKTRIANLAENMIKNSQAMVAASMRNVAANKVFDLMDTAGLIKVVLGSATKPDKNAIKRWKNGKEEWVVPLDDDAVIVMGALGGLQPIQIDGVLRALNTVSGVFRAAMTTRPSFIMNNLWRGAVANGLLTSGANLTPSNNTITGAAKALGVMNPTAYQEFKQISGMGDYRLGQVSSSWGKNDILVDFGLDRAGATYYPRKAFQLWEGLGMASEMADRIAVFDTMVARGVPRDEAAYQALSVMNYSRKGGNATVRAWLSTMPFMNARLQGYARLLEGTVGKDATPATRAAAIGRLALMGAIYTAANAAIWIWNYEDEERRKIYQALPTWRRTMFMNVVISDDFVLTLPQPFELGFLFGSVPTAIMDSNAEHLSEMPLMQALGVKPGAEGIDNAWAQVGYKVIADMMAFSVIPQAIGPFLEGKMNTDLFFGRSIEERSEQGMFSELRTTNADEFAKLIGARAGVSRFLREKLGIDLSPAMISHYGSNFGGVPYTFMAGLTTAFAADVGLAPPRVANVFGEGAAAQFAQSTLKGFVFDPSISRNRWSEEYYEAGRQAEQHAKSFKEVLGQDYQEGAVGATGAYSIFTSTQDELRKLRQAETFVRESETMSPEEKRRQLQVITKTRNGLLEVLANGMTGAMEPPE